MLTQVLLVHNASIPQSLSDAQAYATLRGLPAHLLGVNFGTTPLPVTSFDFTDGTYTVQGLTWDGVVDHSLDGQPIQAALEAIGASRPVDGVILSTHTPLLLDSTSDLVEDSTVPAHAARALYIGRTGGSEDVFPHGRLGCPSGSGNSFNLNTEMTTRAGVKIAGIATVNAVVAETRFNRDRPHLLSTAASFGTSNANVALVNDSFGFTVAYYQALMAAARTARLNWTIDLGTDVPFNTAAPADFANGSRPPLDLWGVCVPMGLNVAGSPGSQVYSGNYRVLPGGWSAHWWSFQWYWAMDFLYNGGSAAIMTVSEPLSDGLRDPAQILPALLSGLSMMELMPRSVITRSCPAWPLSAANCRRVTVVGDPLYRPYATSQPHTVAAPPFWG